MNFSEDEEDFVAYYQRLKLELEKDASPSKAADAHRSLYLHLKEGKISGKTQSVGLLADQHLQHCDRIVDRMDELGLNNFAEGALALCNFHKNESAKWKTSLSVDKILQMANAKELASGTNRMEDPMVTLRDPTKKTEYPIPAPSSNSAPLGTRPFFKPTAQPQSPLLLPSTAQRPFQPFRSQLPNQQPLPAQCNQTPFQAQSPVQQSFTSNHAHAQRPPFGFMESGRGPEDFRKKGNPRSNSGNVYQKTSGNFVQDRYMPDYSRPKESIESSHGAMHNGMMRQNQTNSYDKPVRANSLFGNSFSCNTSNSTGRQTDTDVERLEVNPGKIGGPYANFGQKRKNQPQSQWNPKNSKSCRNQAFDDNEDESGADYKPNPFRTAKQQYVINQQKKHGSAASNDRSPPVYGANYGAVKKSLGTRRGPASKFVPPVLNRDSDDEGPMKSNIKNKRQGDTGHDTDELEDERLRGIDPKMIELINNEIMDHGAQISWDDIAGLEFAKKTIKEIVVWPMLRPDIFTGLRGPPKGLLLFGPPGTGKTLIGKCIASQSKSTFFCISASSLTSKWVGEGEKMVRALFAVARVQQPSVVFIDEIDSLLAQRSDTEHESSRRIKTEFLVQLDGAATGSEDRILVIGATNRPQEIDEAARRRFVKRLLIPLPEGVARRQIVVNLMSQQRADLSQADIESICDKTDGYSGADMTNLCREAALGPIRSIPFEMMETITPDQVRPILLQDFEEALHQVRASVSTKDLTLYTEWNHTYGSFAHSAT